MNNRFQIVPVTESIFQNIDARGFFSSPKVPDTQNLFDCSWNLDRLILKSIDGSRELLEMQNNGSVNAFTCIDTIKQNRSLERTNGMEQEHTIQLRFLIRSKR